MYYEEKIINGVLCYRGNPRGEWIAFDRSTLTTRWRQAEDVVEEMRPTYHACLNVTPDDPAGAVARLTGERDRLQAFLSDHLSPAAEEGAGECRTEVEAEGLDFDTWERGFISCLRVLRLMAGDLLPGGVSRSEPPGETSPSRGAHGTLWLLLDEADKAAMALRLSGSATREDHEGLAHLQRAVSAAFKHLFDMGTQAWDALPAVASPEAPAPNLARAIDEAETYALEVVRYEHPTYEANRFGQQEGVTEAFRRLRAALSAPPSPEGIPLAPVGDCDGAGFPEAWATHVDASAGAAPGEGDATGDTP